LSVDRQTLSQNITSNILIVHADDDDTIPVEHSLNLFSALVEPHLPPSTFTYDKFREGSVEAYKEHEKEQESRAAARTTLVTTTEIHGYGKWSWFDREGQGFVNLLETKWGGHNNIVYSEGVIDFVGRTMGIPTRDVTTEQDTTYY
jgi:abhydrolase domain-containing protein 12